MKRTTIILLTIAIALIAGTASADAKVKKSQRKAKTTSIAMPNVKSVVQFSKDGGKNTHTPEIKLLAKKGDYVIYGNNVKVTITGDFECKATPTSPHAWYTDGCTYYFKSKADRDKIFKDKHWSEIGCCGGWTEDSDGWYNICTCH